MAAAEYFSEAPLGSQHQRPSYQQASQLSQQSVDQQYYPPPQIRHNSQPPPYTIHSQQQPPKPSAQLAPSTVAQRHSFSNHQRPSILTSPQHSWPIPQAQGPYINQHYSSSNMQLQTRPQQFQYQNAPPAQNPNYLSPHTRYSRPHMASDAIEPGYISDPESRRRRHHKHSRRNSGDTRDSSKRSRDISTDALIGATGGGLIGDLIMPGFGALSGAAIGWLGGKDYGRRRKEREDERAEAQRAWEDKYGRSHSYQHHGHRHYSRSRGHTNAGDHHYDDDRSRRRSADDRDRRDEYHYRRLLQKEI